MRYKNLNKSYAAWKADDTPETKEQLGSDLLGFCHNVVTKHYNNYPDTFEEAIGESALLVWRHISTFEARDTCLFSSWVTRIILNICKDIHIKRQKRREQMLVGYEERPSKGLSLVNQFTLANLVNKLSPEDQEFVGLKMQGLSNEELAEHDKTSVGATKMRYSRIVKKLQTFIR